MAISTTRAGLTALPPAGAVLAVAVVGSAILAGCAVGPNFAPPSPPSVDRYGATPPVLGHPAGEAAQTFVAVRAIDRQWWKVFGCRALDAAEDQALAHNNDVDAAKAALRQARELYLAQRASLYPNVQFAGSATRSKNSDTIASPLASNEETYSLYSGQLTLSYVLDVFGGQRRQVENAAALAQVQQDQTDAVYLTVTTNVAMTVLQIAGLNDQRDALDRIVAANRRVLELTRRMQAAGEASTADVAAAESALQSAIEPMRAVQKQAAQLGDVLAIYLGRTPAELDAPELDLATLHLADITLPAALPLSLPSDLVHQRPDIRAAEANLHAASAAAGVALAARLPSFNVTAAAGGASTGLATVLSGPNTLWSVGGNAAATVFDAGALRHRQQAANAALDQAKAQYRGVVLSALQNVADVIQAITFDTRLLDDAAGGAAASARAARIAHAEASQGQIAALPELNMEIAALQADLTLIQARAARPADTVALFQALGGGWSSATARPSALSGGKR